MPDRSTGARTVGPPGPTNCQVCADYYRANRSGLLDLRDLDERLNNMMDQTDAETVARLVGVDMTAIGRRLPTTPRSQWVKAWFHRYHTDGHRHPFTGTSD